MINILSRDRSVFSHLGTCAFFACLAVAPTGGGAEGLATPSDLQRTGISCSSSRDTPFTFQLELRNSGRDPLSLDLVPSVELVSAGDAFWAPFSLESPPRPLLANSGAQLRLAPGERKTFRLDLARLAWGHALAAIWPHGPLDKVVPPGDYEVEILFRSRTAIQDEIRLPAGTLAMPPLPVGTDSVKSTAKLDSLGVRVRKMRKELRGPAPREELRHWTGPLHEAMTALGEMLGDGSHIESEVRKHLGIPDRVAAAGTSHSGIPVAPGQRHLLYAWRGLHDYMYLIVENSKVVETRWYFAGD